MANRRGFLLGIGAALAAPAIVRADSLMKIAVLRESLYEATVRNALRQLELWELATYGRQISKWAVREGSNPPHFTSIPLEEFYAR